jgi:hypothetical protein
MQTTHKNTRTGRLRKENPMSEKEIVAKSEAVSLDEILGFDMERDRQEEREAYGK